METKHNLPRLERLRVLVGTECNLDCLYCHKEGQYSQRGEMKFEDLKGLLKELVDYGIDEIKFSGGEPLLYPHIEKIIDYAKNDLGVKKVSMTTNGTLLEEKLYLLQEIGLDELSISIDTLDYNEFDKLNRGTKEQYNKVLSVIEKAAKSKIPEVNLNGILTSVNLDNIDKLIDYSSELNIPIRLIAFMDVGNKTEKETDGLEVSLKQRVEKLNKTATKQNGNPLEKRQAYTDYKVENTTITLVDGLCPDCENCGKSYALRLTTDGKLKPCLISEKGEVDILTPYKEGNKEEFKNRIEQSIALKKLGLIKYADIPERFTIRQYMLPPEDPKK